MSGDEFKDWGDIELIFTKPGEQWTSAEKASVARWLAKDRRKAYLTIGRLRLGHLQDAEDAFQDFCMKIIKEGFPKFDPQLGTAHVYILKDWRYHLTNHYRKQVRRARHESQMVVDEEGKPLIEETDRHPSVPTLVDLKQRWDRLTDEQKEVLGQRFFYRNGQLKPFKEIADGLGRSEEAVKKIYQRAVGKLGE